MLAERDDCADHFVCKWGGVLLRHPHNTPRSFERSMLTIPKSSHHHGCNRARLCRTFLGHMAGPAPPQPPPQKRESRRTCHRRVCRREEKGGLCGSYCVKRDAAPSKHANENPPKCCNLQCLRSLQGSEWCRFQHTQVSKLARCDPLRRQALRNS